MSECICSETKVCAFHSTRGQHGLVRRLKRENAALRRRTIEECAAIVASLADIMEAGAGELTPGRRLRQAERNIRALAPKRRKKTSRPAWKSAGVSPFRTMEEYEAAKRRKT